LNEGDFIYAKLNVKTVSKNLLAGEGTLGKLIGDTKVYDNIDAATTSLGSCCFFN